jgi:hypothetical protein
VLAWHQPQYVVRGGVFHSVYGTFDYRAGCYDLKDGRQQLIDLIGPGLNMPLRNLSSLFLFRQVLRNLPFAFVLQIG